MNDLETAFQEAVSVSSADRHHYRSAVGHIAAAWAVETVAPAAPAAPAALCRLVSLPDQADRKELARALQNLCHLFAEQAE